MCEPNRRASHDAHDPTPCTWPDYALKWPISSSGLFALVDLGMSDACIAHYYHVGSDQVVELRQRYAACDKRP